MAEREPKQDARLGGRLWMRFSAYGVSAAPLPTMRPTARARLELYDPWERDRAAASEEERPYKQLLRIAQQIQEAGTQRDIPRRQRKLLEAWVRRNGLLGILSHETLEYTTVAHWHETPLREETSAARKRGVRRLAPFQLQLRRTASGWSVSYHRVGSEQPLRTAQRGEVCETSFLNDSAQPAETTYRRWPAGELVREPLGERFQNFFASSSLAESHGREYPSPSTVAFWQSYGEPLGMIVRYGWHLANALGAFEVLPRTEPWQERNATLALQQINDAAYETSLGGRFDDDGAVRLQWASASLLGCFAVMILQDLAAGQRVLRCPACGGVFLSAAHQARFCSSTCRYTHHKRELRRRNTEDKAPR